MISCWFSISLSLPRPQSTPGSSEFTNASPPSAVGVASAGRPMFRRYSAPPPPAPSDAANTVDPASGENEEEQWDWQLQELRGRLKVQLRASSDAVGVLSHAFEAKNPGDVENSSPPQLSRLPSAHAQLALASEALGRSTSSCAERVGWFVRRWCGCCSPAETRGKEHGSHAQVALRKVASFRASVRPVYGMIFLILAAWLCLAGVHCLIRGHAANALPHRSEFPTAVFANATMLMNASDSLPSVVTAIETPSLSGAGQVTDSEPGASAPPARGAPCTPAKKGDATVTMCEPFCLVKAAKFHCTICKCKGCDFCSANGSQRPVAPPVKLTKVASPPTASPRTRNATEFTQRSTGRSSVVKADGGSRLPGASLIPL